MPGVSAIVEVETDLTRTGLVLAASTLYHCYLWSNAGAGDLEISTTAPATRYSGAAQTKSADTIRRYVGWALTDASAAIVQVGNVAHDDPVMPPWIALTLLYGWTNVGSGVELVGYRKLVSGEVQIRGSIAGGTMANGTALFSLPAGYRPALARRFPAVQGNTTCRVNVTLAGDLTREFGGKAQRRPLLRTPPGPR